MTHSFTEIDKAVIVAFSLSALRCRRIRGCWKLPDRRDWLRGKLCHVLMIRAMLSKSLIQLIYLLLASHSVMSYSLPPHGLQFARFSCPSLSPRVCSSSYSLHQWCHLAISSYDTLFSFCPWSYPASGTILMSCLFASDDQSTVASALASVLPVNILSWSPLRLIGLISLLSKGLSRVFSSTTVQRHQFLGIPLCLWSSSYNSMWPLGRSYPCLYKPLSAESCLSFSTHCLGLSSLSCQEAIIFWFHSFSHHLQWFWSPSRGNLSQLPFFPLVFAMQ